MNKSVEDWIFRGREVARGIIRGSQKNEQDQKILDELYTPEELRNSFYQYRYFKGKYKFDQSDFTQETASSKKVFYRYRKYMAVAALFIAVFFIGYQFWIASQQQELSSNIEILTKTPGTTKAFIKLSDGRQVDIADDMTLSDSTQGEIRSVDGILTIRTLDRDQPVVRHTVVVPKSSSFRMVLSDGTKVWLNAGSELEVPSSFIGAKSREVVLKGEGYFEIAKNKTQPFYVQTGDHSVLATGTAFNISAYENDHDYKVSLLEGGVKVYLKAELSETLTPDEQYSYRKSDGFSDKRQVKAFHTIDWVKGTFLFDRETLAEIMKKAERWYDVDIQIMSEAASRYRYSGSMPRNASLQDFLETLKMTNEIDYRMRGTLVQIYWKK